MPEKITRCNQCKYKDTDGRYEPCRICYEIRGGKYKDRFEEDEKIKATS